MLAGDLGRDKHTDELLFLLWSFSATMRTAALLPTDLCCGALIRSGNILGHHASYSERWALRERKELFSTVTANKWCRLFLRLLRFQWQACSCVAFWHWLNKIGPEVKGWLPPTGLSETPQWPCPLTPVTKRPFQPLWFPQALIKAHFSFHFPFDLRNNTFLSNLLLFHRAQGYFQYLRCDASY